DDLRDVDALVVSVGSQGVAWAVVDRRDAEGREARDVGPAVLGERLAADGSEELPRERSIETGSRALREIGDDELDTGERLAQVVDGLLARATRREAVVHRHDSVVGDDIACHSPGDRDSAQSLAI